MPVRRLVRFWILDHYDSCASGVSPSGAAVNAKLVSMNNLLEYRRSDHATLL